MADLLSRIAGGLFIVPSFAAAAWAPVDQKAA
jgi:hypothetical protein